MIVEVPNKPTSPQPIRYTEMIPIYNKNAVPPTLIADYYTCLHKYCTLHRIPNSHPSLRSFSDPRHAFFVKHQRLYKATPPYIDFTLPIPELFLQLNLPCSIEGTIESDLIRSLTDLVSSSSLVPKFRQKTIIYLLEHPDIRNYYMQLISAVILIDNNLYLRNIAMDYAFYYPPGILSNVIFSIEAHNTPDAPHLIDDIWTPTFIALVKANVTQKYHYQKSKNPYYLSTIMRDPPKTIDVIYFKKESMSFHITNWKPYPCLGDDILCPKATYINPELSLISSAYIRRTKEKTIISNTLVKYLFSLVNGDILTLNNLAKLFACMASPEKFSNLSFAVHYDADSMPLDKLKICLTHSLRRKHINPCFYKDFTSFKNISDDKNILGMISCQYDACLALTITDCKPMKNISYINRIKNIIAGQKISTTDRYVGKIWLINTLPLIFFTKSKSELDFTLSEFSPNIINFSHLSADILEEYSALSKSDIEWLNINFTLYGLSLLATKDKTSLGDTQTDIANTPTPNDLLADFINSCCTVTGSEKDFEFNDTLYTAYNNFLNTKYHTTDKGQKSFIAKLNNYPNIIARKQHRDDNGSVRKCTAGIKLNPHPDELSISPVKDESFSMESWFDLLKKIDDLVPDSLYSD